MKDTGSFIFGSILAILLIVVAIVLVPVVGYIIGMFYAILPVISDWMTINGAIDKRDFPGIIAWMAILGFFLKSTVNVKGDNK